MNVNKAKSKSRTMELGPGTSKADSDFDDLDHWENTAPTDEISDLPLEKAPEPTQSAEPSEPSVKELAVPSMPTLAKAPDDSDEFSPVYREGVKPVSLRPHLRLSKVERIGLATLLGLLVIGAGMIVIFSLSKLPTESARVRSNDFPIKGEHIRINSAETYWRVPILGGKNPDTVRRGTEFIPVVRLTTGEGNAAIRVFFRNHEKQSIGDAVTRTVRGGQTFEVPATAGFEDDGMFAAYRTGESEPWTIEVYEAPTANSSNESFKKLFEMNISSDRR